MNLGIAYAMQLPDPDGILEGSGKLHRHVKLKSNADLERPAVKSMLKASLARQKAAISNAKR